jgi:hypothetical protein
MRVPIPTIPSQPTPSGRYTSGPDVVPQQNATGEQLAKFGGALAEAGAAVSRRSDYEQDMLNDATIVEADNLAADAAGKRLQEYTSLIGRAATGDARTTFEKNLNEDLLKIGSDIHDVELRKRWERQAADRRRQAFEHAKAHEFVQTKNFNIGVLEASKDRARIDGDKDLMLLRTDELAQAKGQDSPEQLAMDHLAATTQFHEEQIRLKVNHDPQGARKQLEEAKAAKEIAPNRLDELEGLVRIGTVKDQAARLALDLMNPAKPAPAPRTTVDAGGVELGMTTWNQTLADAGRPVPPTAQEPKRPMTPGEAALQEEAAYLNRYAAARDEVNQRLSEGKIDSDLAGATLANLEANHRAHLQMRAERANQTANQAEKWLSDNPLQGVPQLPATLHTDVEASGLLGQMNDFADNKRYTTDPAVFDEAMAIPDDVMRAMTPATLRSRFRGKLDPRDWNIVQSKYAKAFGQASKNDEIALSKEQRVDEAFHLATGISRQGTMSDADHQRKDLFRRHVQSLLDLEPADKEVTPKRLQEILDTAVQDQAKVRSTTFGIDWISRDANRPTYDLTPDEQKRAYVQIGNESIYLNDIPKGQRALAVEALRSRGLPITEARIADMWIRAGKPQDPK